jgi:hypothetical protein
MAGAIGPGVSTMRHARIGSVPVCRRDRDHPQGKPAQEASTTSAIGLHLADRMLTLLRKCARGCRAAGDVNDAEVCENSAIESAARCCAEGQTTRLGDEYGRPNELAPPSPLRSIFGHFLLAGILHNIIDTSHIYVIP